MRPRVALVSWTVNPPGHRAGGLFGGLIREGHERFDFVCVASRVHPDLAPLVECRRAPALPGPTRLTWASFYATAAVALKRARADVVHAMSPIPAVPNRVDLASVNFCLAGFHEAAGGRPPGANRFAWPVVRALTTGLERFSYRPPRTRLAVVETAAAKATVERHYPELPVVEIPLVYDTNRYRPDSGVRAQVRAELSAGSDDVVALYAGRNPHIKGLDLAVEGLADAHRRGAGQLTLWGAGSPLARRHALEGQVKTLGDRSDMERYFAAADVFVLPTIYEHGSRASHEAAASGLPLVVTATHGPAALIGDDEGGIVIERDPRSIGAALARLAADPGLRKGMGEVARERMLASNGRSYEPFFELYERLAA